MPNVPSTRNHAVAPWQKPDICLLISNRGA